MRLTIRSLSGFLGVRAGTESDAMNHVLGLVSIGQSPRADLVETFRRRCPDTLFLERGALDGLSESDVRALPADPSDYLLHTRLRSGEAVKVSKSSIQPLVAECAHALALQSATAIAILCAGDFPLFDSTVPLLLPGRLLPSTVRAVTRTRRVGVITPIVEQAPYAMTKWTSDGFDPIIGVSTPHVDREHRQKELKGCTTRLRAAGAGVIIVDCFGFDTNDVRYAAEGSTVPVLSAQDVTANVAASVLNC